MPSGVLTWGRTVIREATMSDSVQTSKVWKWTRRVVLWVAILTFLFLSSVALFIWCAFIPYPWPEPILVSQYDFKGYRLTAEILPSAHTTTNSAFKISLIDTLSGSKRILAVSDIGDSVSFAELSDSNLQIFIWWNRLVGRETYQYMAIDSLTVDLRNLPDTIHRFRWP